MPIYGLTDGTPALKEIGRIRKGGEKTEFKPGPNLDHFRVTFREDEKAAQDKFEEIYGTQSVLINVRLAFSNLDDNWSAWYKCFLKGGMLGQADGKTWNYLRDYRSQEVLIRNGALTALGEARKIPLEFDETAPVYFYHSTKQNKDMPVFARPEGRLSVMVPELGRFVYLLALTHSKHDIANISAQLKGIAELARKLRLDVSDIPLILTRRVDQISKPIGNGRGMVDEWLLHIETHPDLAQIAMGYMNRATVYALTAPIQRPPEALPVGVEWDDSGENDAEMEHEGEGEITGGPQFGELAAPVTESTAVIYPEHLEHIVNSDGIPYTQIVSDRLGHMSRSLDTAIKKSGDPDGEKQRKLEAIAEILQIRNGE